jgi:hypothetical protein
MKYSLSLLIGMALIAASCKKEEAQSKGDPRQIVPFTQQAASGIQSQNGAVSTPQSHNLFRENNTGIIRAVAAGVNPAHGQPNHRCDIAVGAPLNAIANGTSTAISTNMPVSKTQQSIQTRVGKQVTAKGMNPPHGEQNHRCDIAVGAPLNSKTASESIVVPQEQNQAETLPPLLTKDKE